MGATDCKELPIIFLAIIIGVNIVAGNVQKNKIIVKFPESLKRQSLFRRLLGDKGY
jgi:hypothetical protein